MRSRGINQRREVVIEFKRTFMIYKRDAPEVTDLFPGTDDRLDRLRPHATSLEPPRRVRDARSSSTTIPRGASSAAKLHLLDAVGCGLAARALGVDRAREAMAESAASRGRRRSASTRGCSRRRRARQRVPCHALDFDDTHTDPVAPRQRRRRPRPRSPPPRRGRGRRRAAAAIVAGNEVVTPGRHGAPGAVPRGASTRPRSAASSAAPRPRRSCAASTPRRRRARWASPAAVAGGCFEHLADGSPTKPLHPGWAAHGGRARRAAGGARRERARRRARGALRPLQRLLGAAASSTSRRSSPTSASAGRRRGSPSSPTRLPLHARLARRDRDAWPDGARRPTRSRRSSRSPRGRRRRSCWSRSRPSAARAASTRRSSASRTRSPPCSCAARSGCTTYTDEAIADPRVLELAAEGALRAATSPTFPQAFPGGVRIRSRRPRSSRPSFPPARRPREPDDGRRGAREVPRERGARARRPPTSRRSRRRCSGSRRLDDLAAVLAAGARQAGLPHDAGSS